MNKLNKFLAIAALTPMLAACGPSPQDLCNHVMDVMAKEFGGDGPSDDEKKEALDKCVKDVEREKEMKGMSKYNKQAKCIMASDNMEAMSKCEEEDEKSE